MFSLGLCNKVNPYLFFFFFIADLDCYLHQSSCFGLTKSLKRFVVTFFGFHVLDLIDLLSLFSPTLVINRKFAKVITNCVRHPDGLQAQTYLHFSYVGCQYLAQLVVEL